MSENSTTPAVNSVWRSPSRIVVVLLSAGAAIAAILIITNCFRLKPSDIVSTWDLVAYFGWAILPPTWFLLEYVWLFADADKLDPAKVDDLKYTHELAGKIWAALLTILTAILYLKYHEHLKLGQ